MSQPLYAGHVNDFKAHMSRMPVSKPERIDLLLLAIKSAMLTFSGHSLIRPVVLEVIWYN